MQFHYDNFNSLQYHAVRYFIRYLLTGTTISRINCDVNTICSIEPSLLEIQLLWKKEWFQRNDKEAITFFKVAYFSPCLLCQGIKFKYEQLDEKILKLVLFKIPSIFSLSHTPTLHRYLFNEFYLSLSTFLYLFIYVIMWLSLFFSLCVCLHLWFMLTNRRTVFDKFSGV